MQEHHPPTPPHTVSELIDRFLEWAEDYYQHRERTRAIPTGHAANLASSLGHHFREVAGHRDPQTINADDICLLQTHLQQVRKRNGKRLSRGYINRCCNHVRQLFKWAAQPPRRWVPVTILQDMKLAEGLKAGRCDAAELPPVQPVSKAQFDLTIARLATFSESRPVWAMRLSAMLDILWHSGMRPGELVRMRNDDAQFSIDRVTLHLFQSREIEIMVYKPRRHKTAHHGVDRNIFLSPSCRTQIEQWRSRTPPGERLFPYTTGSFREAILRLNARTSNGLGDSEPSIPRWVPYQIRHAFATRMRSEAGIDVAQVLMGHRNRSTTEIYAAPDATAAIDAIWRYG